jgi:hypothetical protein
VPPPAQLTAVVQLTSVWALHATACRMLSCAGIHLICFVLQVGEEAAGAVEDAKEMFEDASEEAQAEE